MMMTEMDIETSVYYVHLTQLIAREDYIKFTRRESTETYTEEILQMSLQQFLQGCETIKLRANSINTELFKYAKYFITELLRFLKNIWDGEEIQTAG
jgi:hypothetical protein